MDAWVAAWDARRQEIRALIDVDPVTGCWLWPLDQLEKGGYGLLGSLRAHRCSYEAFVGPIPIGYVIDHLCRTRRCVNPSPQHLEAVPKAENDRRAQTYVQQHPGERVHKSAQRWCIRHHPFDEQNTGRDRRGRRYCKRCRREHTQRWRKEVAGQSDRAPEWHVDTHRWLADRDSLVPVLSGRRLRTVQVAELWGVTPEAFTKWRLRNPGLLRPVAGGGPGHPYFWSEAEARALEAYQTTEPWRRGRCRTD